MKQRIFSILLAATMIFTVTACKNEGGEQNAGGEDVMTAETEEVVIDGISYNKATDLTKDEITLSYFNFDQPEITQMLAERFMEIYPNIKVNNVYENVATYNDTLLTLVSNNETPDVMMYSDADFALSNFLLRDISTFWNNDPETKNLASTINDVGLGTFDTSKRYAVPVKLFPGIMFIDLDVLETLNIEAPKRDWVWADMIKLIKDATVLDSPDGMEYYGLGFLNRLDSYYGIAAGQELTGEFGYNGEHFDLSIWAIGEQEFSDLRLGGYVAPTSGTLEMEEWTGDFDGWFGNTGHVALFSEAFWTFQNIWNTTEFKENFNVEVVPYVIPAVQKEDAKGDGHNSISTIDFGGVSSATKYPREAYELLKFMSFGVDGWKTRNAIYKDETKVNESGIPLKNDNMPVPVTLDEGIWKDYIDVYTEGMDETVRGYWEEYFKSCMQPIPYGWQNLAGYWNFVDQYFNNIGIHDLVDTGQAKAADYADEATRKANYYHAQAMLDYFGEEGYNVLSEEEVKKYTDMVANNQ